MKIKWAFDTVLVGEGKISWTFGGYCTSPFVVTNGSGCIESHPSLSECKICITFGIYVWVITPTIQNEIGCRLNQLWCFFLKSILVSGQLFTYPFSLYFWLGAWQKTDSLIAMDTFYHFHFHNQYFSCLLSPCFLTVVKRLRTYKRNSKSLTLETATHGR